MAGLADAANATPVQLAMHQQPSADARAEEQVQQVVTLGSVAQLLLGQRRGVGVVLDMAVGRRRRSRALH